MFILFKEVIRFFSIMASTITLSGNRSVLTAEFFPPIELQKNTDYVCGLVDFQTYNSIPNIDETNNLFHIGDEIITIPLGSYEIVDIYKFIYQTLVERKRDYNFVLFINTNTLQCILAANVPILLNQYRTIGKTLGFTPKELLPNIKHKSDMKVNISKVNAVRIECNIITGSYVNNKLVHTIHEFAPVVPPGYKIVEVPRNVIYLPVNVKQITTVTIKLVDQDNHLINFRGETVTVRLHIKPNNANF